ncbi:hypothetical protein [Caulobacter sp. S45]|uniref:hypothetical protein n=1 Tax=Caulobacter sp. S45 TaxID=1641861 RepID=UPI001576882E|nr:hypothetical protein [Caulobacter sp. S45]
MGLSPGQFTALRNLASKQAGGDVDWINIGDARALTALGFAERSREGWKITAAGTEALKLDGPSDEAPGAAETSS